MSAPLYDTIGVGYSRFRRPDPRIAAHVAAALGSARSVLNVGAGTGSYEPTDRTVVAVEPSAAMVAQRRRSPAAVVRAVAERLPLRTGAVDAAMAVLTLHHWADLRAGLMEMRRVARDRVVILTHDPEREEFWLTRDYFPEILAIDRQIMPTLDEIAACLGPAEILPVPIPHDCTDGFLGAYWRRPERYLEPEARGAISSFTKISDAEPGLARLASDLGSGRWRERYGALLDRTELDIGYRILIAGAG